MRIMEEMYMEKKYTKRGDIAKAYPEQVHEEANGEKKNKKIFWMRKDPGIDGILVTVGLCIIALLLCVVMKESLAGFIQTIMGEMTTKASEILKGVSGGA